MKAHPRNNKSEAPARSKFLTVAMEKLLRQMIDEEDELAMDGIQVFVGATRYSRATVNKLVELCLITPDDGRITSTYWHLTPCGRNIIKDSNYEPAIVTSMRTGKPVFRR